MVGNIRRTGPPPPQHAEDEPLHHTEEEAEWAEEAELYREGNPRHTRRLVEGDAQHFAEGLAKDVQTGRAIRARDTDDALMREAQAIIDGYARGLLPSPPDLYVYKPDPTRGPNVSHEAAASAHFGNVITMPQARLSMLEKDPALFRALMAHETAHQVNGDMTVESRMHYLQRPLNAKTEVLAHRMGAVLFGDVRGYTAEFDKLPLRKDSADSPDNAQLREHMKQWEGVLNKAGAAKDGVIIDRDWAMEVFRRSKFIAGFTGSEQGMRR